MRGMVGQGKEKWGAKGEREKGSQRREAWGARGKRGGGQRTATHGEPEKRDIGGKRRATHEDLRNKGRDIEDLGRDLHGGVR